MVSVEALLVGRQMILAGLGRAIVSAARVNRLIGNRHLWEERTELYGAIAGLVLGRAQRPVIILDWSDMREDRSWQLLRARVPVGAVWRANDASANRGYWSHHGGRARPNT